MDKNKIWAEARMALESAMADFVKAARDIGCDNDKIGNDVLDVLYDASDEQICSGAFVSWINRS